MNKMDLLVHKCMVMGLLVVVIGSFLPSYTMDTPTRKRSLDESYNSMMQQYPNDALRHVILNAQEEKQRQRQKITDRICSDNPLFPRDMLELGVKSVEELEEEATRGIFFNDAQVRRWSALVTRQKCISAIIFLRMAHQCSDSLPEEDCNKLSASERCLVNDFLTDTKQILSIPLLSEPDHMCQPLFDTPKAQHKRLIRKACEVKLMSDLQQHDPLACLVWAQLNFEEVRELTPHTQSIDPYLRYMALVLVRSRLRTIHEFADYASDNLPVKDH